MPYVPRLSQSTPLFRCLEQHLNTFIERSDLAGGLPFFVKRELLKFSECGVLAHGFARLRCTDCKDDRLVPFSCKGRGFCPSCGGRRMSDTAAYLSEVILYKRPVRQWVLTFPVWLRRAVAHSQRLASRILAIHIKEIESYFCSRSSSRGQIGAVTVIQRFGGALNLNPHFHTLVPDGLFVKTKVGTAQFRPVGPPTTSDINRILHRIMQGILRFLQNNGFAMSRKLGGHALNDCVDASIGQYQLLGASPGNRLPSTKVDGPQPNIRFDNRLVAKSEGFSLHAGVYVPATDPGGLELLCRYVARPAISQKRLSMRADGHMVYRLRSPWRDGTTEIVFSPLDFIARLAALVPPPRSNLIRYHGVFAPAAKLRKSAISSGLSEALVRKPNRTNPVRRNLLWAELMARVFGVNVLRCPKCGGECRVIAMIDDPPVIRKILGHMGLPTEPIELAPARGPPLDYVDVPTALDYVDVPTAVYMTS